MLTTWQGSLLYGIVIAVNLVAVNRQQRALIEQNSLNLEPVRAALTPAASIAEQGTPTTLLRELRPLENLSDQPPERWLSALRQADASRPGVLEMTLSQASAVTVRSGGGDRLHCRPKGQHHPEPDATADDQHQPRPTSHRSDAVERSRAAARRRPAGRLQHAEDREAQQRSSQTAPLSP